MLKKHAYSIASVYAKIRHDPIDFSLALEMRNLLKPYVKFFDEFNEDRMNS
jgi:hypothetical protein